MPDPTPEQCAEFQAHWTEAFKQMIALSRRLKPKFPSPEFVREWCGGIAEIGVGHGMTEDETWNYADRILAAVLREPQA